MSVAEHSLAAHVDVRKRERLAWTILAIGSPERLGLGGATANDIKVAQVATNPKARACYPNDRDLGSYHLSITEGEIPGHKVKWHSLCKF